MKLNKWIKIDGLFYSRKASRRSGRYLVMKEDANGLRLIKTIPESEMPERIKRMIKNEKVDGQ